MYEKWNMYLKRKKKLVGKEKVCIKVKRFVGVYFVFYSMKWLGILLFLFGCNILVDYKVIFKICWCLFIILGMRNIVKRKVFCLKICIVELRLLCFLYLENNI